MQTQDLVDDFLAHLKARNMKPKTLLWYADLRRFAVACPELPLTPEPIERFLGGLECSDDTKFAYWRRLRALYQFARQRRRITRNPMTAVSRPQRLHKVPPTMEECELRALAAAATSARDREMVLLTIDNGMRAAELAGLQWVHIRGNYIKVALKMREKYIPISDERRRALLKLRENSDSEYVFVNNRGDPLTSNGVYQVFRRLMDKAGIAGPKLGPHRVRHAIARGMIMQGADMATVQYTLGHSSISSTRVYTQLTPPDVIKKHARYSMAKVVASPLQGAMFEDEVVEAAEAIIAARRSGDNV